MKQKLKEYKGITLLALIITIIVLLILAVVAIKAVKGDGIISHAKNAKTQYSGAQKNEQDMLSDYELILAEKTGNVWKQDKTKVTRGNTTLNVGDTITNFTAGGKTWKVLGAENGKLLLTIPGNGVARKTISGSDATLGVWDEKTSSYKNAEDELNKICVENIKLDNLTDKIKSKVTEVRSIKVEDINRVTGYNPVATGDGKAYGAEGINQYENKVTYSMNASGKVAYSSAIKSSDGTGYMTFWAPNTSANITSPYTVKSTSYYYYPYSLTTESSTTGICKGIPKTGENNGAYILLFGDPANNTSNANYWLASSYVCTTEGRVDFGLRNVSDGHVKSQFLWDSHEGKGSFTLGVRPVVSLRFDIGISKDSNSGAWVIDE